MLPNSTLSYTNTAVNILLQSIGELPLLDDLEIQNSQQYLVALYILEEVKRGVLSEGWNINSLTGVEIEPEPTAQEYIVPSNVLSLWTDSKSVIVYDNRLYDKVTNKALYGTGNIKVNALIDMDFDMLPYALRYYITLKSARIFVARLIGDPNSVAFSLRDEEDGRQNALREDTRGLQNNILNSVFGSSVANRS